MPREALAKFVGGLRPDLRDRRLAYYRKGYHLLLRDLDGAAVAGDVANWVLDRRAPLPSQADRHDTAQSWPPEKSGSDNAKLLAPAGARG